MRRAAYVLVGLLLAGSAILGCGEDNAAAPAEADVAITPDAGKDSNTTTPEVTLPDIMTLPDTKPDVPEPRDPCELIGAGHCMMPFPSDHFRIDERLDFSQATLQEGIDPTQLGGSDGYSVVTPVVFYLEGGTLKDTASVLDIARSLDADSPTRVVNVETGEPVAHWVELDHFSVAADVPIYTLRFAAPLAFGQRYVVGVRGLVDADLTALLPTPFFAELRETEAFFEDTLSFLGPTFATPGDVQLAWAFTTASAEHGTRDLLSVRDVILAEVGDAGAPITVDDVIEYEGDEDIALRLEATAHVPSVLLDPDDLGVRRVWWDDIGGALITGTEDVPVDIWIPHSVVDAPGPVPILQYGHGLFGSRKEAENGWIRAMANRLGFIVVASDMQGMSEVDVGVWGVVLTADVTAVGSLPEQPFQGFCNHLAIARALKTFAHEGITVDPARVYYYGNSQGGTIGSLLMSLQTDIERGVLGVPGGAYSLLLNRSTGFSEFAGILKIPFPDPMAFTVAFALIQTVMDRMDPMAYAHLTAPRRVLLQVAKEDSQVQNDVSFLLGRALGARLMVPTPRPLFGFEETAYPFEGTALVEYDFNKPDNPNP
ncbi:MAG: hypothetical protein ACI9WU_004571, partial [Myxococcota bacterium]